MSYCEVLPNSYMHYKLTYIQPILGRSANVCFFYLFSKIIKKAITLPYFILDRNSFSMLIATSLLFSPRPSSFDKSNTSLDLVLFLVGGFMIF